MAIDIRGVQYYYATIRDAPGEGYRILAELAAEHINLLAFTAVPIGPGQTQLVIFPEHVEELVRAAEHTGLALSGPQNALFIQGDDRLGAIAEIHRKLADARINIHSCSGVADGRGGYGYVVYVKPEDYESAARVLGT